jgi:hypothetical protein
MGLGPIRLWARIRSSVQGCRVAGFLLVTAAADVGV